MWKFITMLLDVSYNRPLSVSKIFFNAFSAPRSYSSFGGSTRTFAEATKLHDQWPHTSNFEPFFASFSRVRALSMKWLRSLVAIRPWWRRRACTWCTCPPRWTRDCRLRRLAPPGNWLSRRRWCSCTPLARRCRRHGSDRCKGLSFWWKLWLSQIFNSCPYGCSLC